MTWHQTADKPLSEPMATWWTSSTRWGQVTHLCVRKLTIIGSGNGFSPGQRQAMVCLNIVDLTHFSEILTGIYTFPFKKMHLIMSFGILSQPQCVNDPYKSLMLNELTVHRTLTLESATWLRPSSEIMSVTRAPRSASDLSRGKRRLAENRRFSRMVRVPMTTSSWN